ncbi:hypothetical protein Tco_0621003, partial [Tanacetum coccineum]
MGNGFRSLGGNSSSGIEKYRGLNSSDGGNIRDRVKIAGGVIGSGDEIGRFPLVRLVSSLQGFNSSGLHFSTFFNDPRIIWEQRIAAFKGYRGGGLRSYSDGVEGVGGATAEVAKRRGHVPLSLAMKCSKQ